MKKIKIVIRIIIVFLLMFNVTIMTLSHQQTNEDYSNWMRDSIDPQHPITEIAMLGAHNAFSSEITYFSEPGIDAHDIFSHPAAFPIKGYLIRQSVTQRASTKELLEDGIRYFDMRLTYKNHQFYTVHNYMSEPLEDVLQAFQDFHESIHGEFILIDIQHISGVDYQSVEHYQSLMEVFHTYDMIEESFFEPTIPLHSVTFGDVTNNKQKTSYVILDKFDVEHKETYQYVSNMRSSWPNKDRAEDIINYLVDESNMIAQMDKNTLNFRVMQAVATTALNVRGVMKSIMDWSVIHRATRLNQMLYDHESFERWMTTMPIIMLDFTNNNTNGLLDDYMSRIISYNQAFFD